MKKLKLFIENIFVYGIGGVISKIIPLIMVPVVTAIMPSTDYFGISDLSNTVVQFGAALALMGMYDAMYRMFFDKDDLIYKKTICSTALVFTFFTSIVVFFVLLFTRNLIATFFFKDKQYAYVVYLSAMATLVGATNQIVSAPTRMQNKRKLYIAANTIGPLLSYSISIPLLMSGFYVIALPLSAVISGVIIEVIFGIVNREWFKPSLFDGLILKQMLVIAIPLLPNFLVYWVFNSCDRLMITSIIGVGAAGVYAVGSKLGHASQLIYTAFAGGWQFFAFSTMNEENQVESNSMIYEYLGVISFVATSFICAFSFSIFRLLFKEEYLEGYIVAPYLFLAPLLQMLFQVACNQFLVIKKTWPNPFILSIGAICNLLVNALLIPLLGIEGAAIATLTGYVISNVICVIVLLRMKKMIISIRFVASFCMIVGYILLWRLFFSSKLFIGVILALIDSLSMILLYRADIHRLLSSIRKRNGNNHNR